MKDDKSKAMKRPRRWPGPWHPVAGPVKSTGSSDGDSSLGAHAPGPEMTPRTGRWPRGKKWQAAVGGRSRQAIAPYGTVAREHQHSANRCTGSGREPGSGLRSGKLHRRQTSTSGSGSQRKIGRGTEFPRDLSIVPRAHASYRSRSVSLYPLRETFADFCLLASSEAAQ